MMVMLLFNYVTFDGPTKNKSHVLYGWLLCGKGGIVEIV